jgi:hypothetical protein
MDRENSSGAARRSRVAQSVSAASYLGALGFSRRYRFAKAAKVGNEGREQRIRLPRLKVCYGPVTEIRAPRSTGQNALKAGI